MQVFLAVLQAIALITAPADGQAIAGVVAINGAASHPQFVRYELAFAYDPNLTDTWFEIQPPAATPIADGVLATWDTTRITDGVYMLRLRVFDSVSAQPAEVIVRGIQIRNSPQTHLTQPPPAQPTAPAATAVPQAAPDAAAAPTGVAVSTPSVAATTPAPPDLSPYSAAFCSGAYAVLAAFAGIGTYAILRDRIRRPIRRWLRRFVSDIRKP